MRLGEAIAREVRTLVLRTLDAGASHRLKADGSFVTEIDLAVEDLVRSRLNEAFPADLPSADDLGQEVIAIGERRQFVACGKAEVFDRLVRAHESVRTYCDCFGHALAVEGAVGAMVDYNLHIWDVAAAEILIREAGGVYRRMNQEGVADRPGGRYDVIFGKPAVVEWLCQKLEAEAEE